VCCANAFGQGQESKRQKMPQQEEGEKEDEEAREDDE
jgi:hypothetical protein